ncbi:hypothetical protein N7520_009179 [Penicillium odoratum]|uniref:uncharacterized protein n=1 Tax=Penicillium odoratum TaxID=1167516 RepID=UPI0025487ED8|nr:uncharacterized protein N7520_009179 [Penicillium odoratum]KAJ5752262.1 hypothetical protein N7520_009179 [Penicillium odoratum]
MGHLLFRGWVIAALAMQTFALTLRARYLTTTTTAEPVSIQSTATTTLEASVTAQSTSTTTLISVPGSPSETEPSGAAPTESAGQSTTSTIVSTRTATITACPSATPNCPPSSKTTFLTTETIIVSTTCPQQFVQSPKPLRPHLLPLREAKFPQAPELGFTTSTVCSTRTATITACLSSVTDCPARLKTTFLTTETITVSTTICPITEAAGATQTSSASESTITGAANQGTGNGGSESTISTIWSTRVATVYACPASVTKCPLRSKTSYLTTETPAIGTTAYAVSAQPTTPAEGVTATTSIVIADSQATNSNSVTALPKVTVGASFGSSGEAGAQDSGSSVAVVYTALYTVESCGNGSSCTEYVNTVVMTQTNVAQTTITYSIYRPAYGSGFGGVPTASASAHVGPQGSQSGASTAGASSTSSAPYAVYTGAASSNLQWSMLLVIGAGMVMLLAILA